MTVLFFFERLTGIPPISFKNILRGKKNNSSFAIKLDLNPTLPRINIPKNKSAGKFIEKSFNELDIYNGWRSASYDAAMDDINKVVGKSAGDIRSFKYTLNNYIKENYPQIFKNYDVNEIFSLTTSSVRGSYPYAYFIDLTKNDINQKALSSFQGKASIAEGKIQKAITNFRRTGNQKFYNEAVRVADVFNNTTRKNFLSEISECFKISA